MIIFFLVMSFGLMFTHRTTLKLLNRKTLPEAICSRIIKIQLIFFWVMTLLSPWTPVLFLCFLIFFQFIVVNRLESILNIILRHRFDVNMLKFIDEMILLMITAKSFRDSFNMITQNSDDYFHLKLRNLISLSTLQPMKPIEHKKNTKSEVLNQKEFLYFHNLVQSLELNPHKSLDKLKTYRRELQININFEKKLRQSTLQIRLQALLLTVLYIGLLVFIFKVMRGIISFKLLGTSLILFLSGHLLILILGKKRKWKT